MISIVVPLFNEEESIAAFYKELLAFVSKNEQNYEILFIDDGSTDSSLETLKNIATKNNNVRVFSFRRNQGKAEALGFGFLKAKGETIITLDADLQDIPSEIPKLLKKLQQGYDLISGWRKNRKDDVGKVFWSRLFNYLAGVLWGLHLHDYNCGLKAYKAETAKSLRIYGGLHRFIPLLLYLQGYKVAEVEIQHAKRKYGVSKFGVSKIWNDLPDIFTMLFLTRYSARPLHFFGLIGGLFTFIGITMLTYLTVLHYFFNQTVGRRPLLLIGALFVSTGFQVFFTGFLADLLINLSHQRDYEESINRRIGIKYAKE